MNKFTLTIKNKGLEKEYRIQSVKKLKPRLKYTCCSLGLAQIIALVYTALNYGIMMSVVTYIMIEGQLLVMKFITIIIWFSLAIFYQQGSKIITIIQILPLGMILLLCLYKNEKSFKDFYFLKKKDDVWEQINQKFLPTSVIVTEYNEREQRVDLYKINEKAKEVLKIQNNEDMRNFFNDVKIYTREEYSKKLKKQQENKEGTLETHLRSRIKFELKQKQEKENIMNDKQKQKQKSKNDVKIKSKTMLMKSQSKINVNQMDQSKPNNDEYESIFTNEQDNKYFIGIYKSQEKGEVRFGVRVSVFSIQTIYSVIIIENEDFKEKAQQLKQQLLFSETYFNQEQLYEQQNIVNSGELTMIDSEASFTDYIHQEQFSEVQNNALKKFNSKNKLNNIQLNSINKKQKNQFEESINTPFYSANDYSFTTIFQQHAIDQLNPNSKQNDKNKINNTNKTNLDCSNFQFSNQSNINNQSFNNKQYKASQNQEFDGVYDQNYNNTSNTYQRLATMNSESSPLAKNIQKAIKSQNQNGQQWGSYNQLFQNKQQSIYSENNSNNSSPLKNIQRQNSVFLYKRNSKTKFGQDRTSFNKIYDQFSPFEIPLREEDEEYDQISMSKKNSKLNENNSQKKIPDFKLDITETHKDLSGQKQADFFTPVDKQNLDISFLKNLQSMPKLDINVKNNLQTRVNFQNNSENQINNMNFSSKFSRTPQQNQKRRTNILKRHKDSRYRRRNVIVQGLQRINTKKKIEGGNQ
ncbi:hypothetical protein PPERSA_06921 [Pseudocohnilembus persalinus]|uniref:Transmembrane protein n=1 Tax=Pseudocohnilembus persalinus TaxID=266149 RepID=A0A0V0QZ10_PSEPJ|nr:hypothetical protein PPERSA_06921 [Pseudocohnilembus persalinus]|eukprot:KRX07306.1 hypothetical protein PPERSA_06921 [Pseudocohnilembus persalinus]